MPKPSDLYIGAMAFFSILLPGTLLTAALIATFHPMAQEPLRTLLASAGAGWVAFALSAYALGHFAFLASSTIDEPIYDRYRAWRWPKQQDRRFLLARDARDRFFGCNDDTAPMGTFAWIKAMLRVRAPEALADVEQYEAESKFFRSLILVLPITGAAFVTGALGTGAVVAMTIASFIRYAERRHKSTEWAYGYILVLEGQPAGVSSAPKPTASPAAAG